MLLAYGFYGAGYIVNMTFIVVFLQHMGQARKKSSGFDRPEETADAMPPSKTVPALYPESSEFQAMPEVVATGFMVGLV